MHVSLCLPRGEEGRGVLVMERRGEREKEGVREEEEDGEEEREL